MGLRAGIRLEITLQVALITPLLHIKGYSAPETQAAVERARELIQQAEALGESPEDPLLLFSVLYGLWTASITAFSGDVARELAAQFLTFAEKQEAVVPQMVGHRVMGVSLLFTGDPVQGLVHLDRAIALYDPEEHRLLATLLGQDLGVAALVQRSLALWILGYPDDALAELNRALSDAREIGQAGTLMYVLFFTSQVHLLRGDYAVATRQGRELVALAEEKASSFWRAVGSIFLGRALALAGKASDAVHVINAALTAAQSVGATYWLPLHLSYLAIGLCRNEPIRRCVALHSRSDDSSPNDQGCNVRV
jgi:predicted ATPase